VTAKDWTSREGLPMTKKVILAITLLLAGLVAGVSSAEGSEAAPVYYVALGDSLATGAQPAPSGQTAALRAANGTNSGTSTCCTTSSESGPRTCM
jgi:hypothetical protein